jgi:hypothetical protein
LTYRLERHKIGIEIESLGEVQSPSLNRANTIGPHNEFVRLEKDESKRYGNLGNFMSIEAPISAENSNESLASSNSSGNIFQEIQPIKQEDQKKSFLDPRVSRKKGKKSSASSTGSKKSSKSEKSNASQHS